MALKYRTSEKNHHLDSFTVYNLQVIMKKHDADKEILVISIILIFLTFIVADPMYSF